MEGKNLTLIITKDNWRNWIVFLLTILPLTEEEKRCALDKIGDFEW